MNTACAELRLIACDAASARRLLAEIEDVRAKSLDISIADVPPDLAYRNPEAIGEVYADLAARGHTFRQTRASILRQNPIYPLIHWSSERPRLSRALAKLPLIRHSRRTLKTQLDADRNRILYTGIAASPWLGQCGRALALLTIAAAHDLRCVADDTRNAGRYAGMGGPLTGANLHAPFTAAGNITGTSVTALLSPAHASTTDSTTAASTAATGSSAPPRHLTDAQAFLDAPITEGFRHIVRYCSDSLGIRERKDAVNALITDHLRHRHHNGHTLDTMTMLSVGCGTALPVLEAMRQLYDDYGQCPRLILLDQDPVALKAAEELAAQMGLAERIELQCHSLFTPRGTLLDLATVLNGRMLDVVEDSGLREYLPDTIYVHLTRASMRALVPGGLMVTSNMNVNRPQKEFLRGLMGWPLPVIHRTIMQGVRLHERAGISAQQLRIQVLPSGVYTVFSATAS